MRDRLLAGLERRLGGIHVNGSMNHRLPHNLNVSVSGLAGESLLVGIDDVAVSSGAAAGFKGSSQHVLTGVRVAVR